MRASKKMRIVLKTLQLLIGLSVLFFTSSAAYCQSQSSDAGLTSNPVFIKNCAKCHGDKAQGRYFRGPALSSDKVATASQDELRNIITNGKRRMPKYKGKLTSDEIETLARQVKALGKK